MTIGDWLRTRRPEAPPALAARVAVSLRPYAAEDAATAAGRCMDAAERLLVDLLAHASPGRECALDLLTVDALVTYAFEAASDEPRLLEARAQRAMIDVARLGAGAAGGTTAGAGGGTTC